MEMQADEDAKNRWPFTGPACRVIGRDGETKPPGPATDGTELQGEIGDAAQGTKREEDRRREAGQHQAREVVERSRGTVQRVASLPAADQYIGPLNVAGRSQVGRAAWYGNHHVGRLTSSGERLDTVHPTAAHRSLPLHSLVRVTNFNNGRSVVVRINDRGPVSPSLLIDMSPSAAAAIDMINQGIARVMIEPVASSGGVGSSLPR